MAHKGRSPPRSLSGGHEDTDKTLKKADISHGLPFAEDIFLKDTNWKRESKAAGGPGQGPDTI